jgi:hypothetical protein
MKGVPIVDNVHEILLLDFGVEYIHVNENSLVL